MAHLTLYHFEGCPNCTRVRNIMAKKNIALPLKDTHQDPTAREELIKIGGKPQVPCLVIDGNALYESLAIIEWLENNFKK